MYSSYFLIHVQNRMKNPLINHTYYFEQKKHEFKKKSNSVKCIFFTHNTLILKLLNTNTTIKFNHYN